MNSWVMGKKFVLWGHSELYLRLFCHQILSSASLSCSGHFSQIWRNSQKVVRRYDVHKNGTVGQHKYIMLVLKNMFCEVAVTLIFDHRPLKSIKVIPESKWTLTQNVKKFSQGDSDILCSQKLDLHIQTTWEHHASGHGLTGTEA